MADDLVIRVGLLMDGTGAAPVPGDLAIHDGVITVLVHAASRGREETNAEGLIVTPGFIDLNTPLDARVGWDTLLKPLSWHVVKVRVLVPS